MTPEQKELVSAVEDLQGVKATELMVELVQRATEFPHANWPVVLEECVNAGLVLEVEYWLPKMAWRTKSFILPVGTEVKTTTESKG